MRTVIQISDLHFGTHNVTIAEDLLASVVDRAPQLVVISGDLTQRARQDEFAQAAQFLAQIPNPKLVIPGNHDIPLYNVWARLFTPLQKYARYVSDAGVAGGFFSDDEIAFLGLNTVRRLTGKNGRVSLEQIAHIGRAFRETPKHLFKALVTHHPLGVPLDAETVDLAGRAGLALDALANVGVRLLLSGHHHRAESGHIFAGQPGGRRSVLVLYAGTAISTRVRGHHRNSYNLLHIERDQVGVSVMQWESGQGFQEDRRSTYVCEGGHWQVKH